MYGVVYILVADVYKFSSFVPVLRGDHVAYFGVVKLNDALFIRGPCELHVHLLNDLNLFNYRGHRNLFNLGCREGDHTLFPGFPRDWRPVVRYGDAHHGFSTMRVTVKDGIYINI